MNMKEKGGEKDSEIRVGRSGPSGHPSKIHGSYGIRAPYKTLGPQALGRPFTDGGPAGRSTFSFRRSAARKEKE